MLVDKVWWAWLLQLRRFSSFSFSFKFAFLFEVIDPCQTLLYAAHLLHALHVYNL